MKAKLALFSVLLSWVATAITPFDLQWMNHKVVGTNYKSSAHPKGVFLIETYFRNCPYCVQNAPNVNDLAGKYANEPRVQVIDLGIDKTDAEYASWIALTKPNHPVLKDAGMKVVRELGTTGYPSTYVLDSQLKVVYKHSGVWASAARRQIQITIDQLLKSKEGTLDVD